MLKMNTKFGRLTVIKDCGREEVHCRCRCGKIKIITRNNLVNGGTSSCGCLKSEMLRKKWKAHSQKTGPKLGDIFGRLTVIKEGRQYVFFRCSCGTKKWLYKYDVLNGKTISCGCYCKETSSAAAKAMFRKHGGWGTREWNLWHNMKRRCDDTNAMGYERYGGRGITVCNHWRGPEGFSHFLEDMGKAPSPKHSLDRINPRGNYEPGNVKWSTAKEQARNRTSNRMITAFGKTQCLAAWEEEIGLSRTTISLRILKGLTPEQALTRKTNERR